MIESQENINWEEKFKNEYVLFLLRNGVEPITVFKFCEDLGTDESVFYTYYNSFRSLEKDVWATFFTEVQLALEKDEEYENYSSHEKFLSFLYTFIEVLKQNRSYVVFRYSEIDRKTIRPWFMDAFRDAFSSWSKDILAAGFSTEEIASRPVISSKYNEALWVQLLYVIRVWTNDESQEFQITDAAIEKSTALIFELMKKGPVDLLIDFLKFAYQNKAY